MDLSGVYLNFVTYVSELIQNIPSTKDDAITRYNDINILLGRFLTQNLTAADRKAALNSMFLLRDVKTKCW